MGLKLLLIEDDPLYARLVTEVLSHPPSGKPYQVSHVETLLEGLERLGDASAFDVVLLDLGLPDAQGLETVQAVRERAPLLPLVVLSGQDDLEMAINAMRLGAQEYLVKGQAEDALLARALRYAVERKAREDVEQLLVGIASHDLKGPLQVLVVCCELLRRGGLDPQQERVLGRMKVAIENAGRLVHNLLDVTRTRLGRTPLPIERSDCDAGQVVLSVVDELRLAHPSRRLDCLVRGRALGSFDAGRIRQLVLNLATNALEHSQEPSPVTVTCDAVAEAGHVVISVANEGEPIPDEVMGSIFDPLRRGAVRGSPLPDSRNIGLGLYIVREVARAHGGQVEVCSRAGEGTVFTVRLPYGEGR